MLRDILGSQGTAQFCETFWHEMSHIAPGLDRRQPATWNFPKGAHGICSSLGLPQSDFAWQVRTSERAHDAFSCAFGVRDLVVSTDAVILSCGKACLRPKPWLHRDQTYTLNLLSYQGIYSLYESGAGSGGTVLLPGTHKESYDWEKDCASNLSNFVPVPKELQEEFARCAVKPCMPPDSLLVFNSRLVHAGEAAREDRVDPETGCPLMARIAVPLAFCPKTRRSEKVRQLKVNAYQRGLGATHWPDDRFCLKKASRWEYVKGLQTLPLPAMDKVERLNLL